jgi:hypothetical protein
MGSISDDPNAPDAVVGCSYRVYHSGSAAFTLIFRTATERDRFLDELELRNDMKRAMQQHKLRMQPYGGERSTYVPLRERSGYNFAAPARDQQVPSTPPVTNSSKKRTMAERSPEGQKLSDVLTTQKKQARDPVSVVVPVMDESISPARMALATLLSNRAPQAFPLETMKRLSEQELTTLLATYSMHERKHEHGASAHTKTNSAGNAAAGAAEGASAAPSLSAQESAASGAASIPDERREDGADEE